MMKIFDGEKMRDMTQEEIANYEIVCAERQAEAQARVDAAEAKAVALQAVLEKLGLTEQEAQLLLGS